MFSKVRLSSVLLGFLLLSFSPGPLHAGSPVILSSARQEATLSELTLSNLFSEGWDQPWAKRPHPDGSPDMTLLRVQTNFLVRRVRLDYFFQESSAGVKTDNVQNLAMLLAWSFNRRFMLEVSSNEQWSDLRAGGIDSGTAGAATARFQLIDTLNSSYAFQVRTTLPNQSLGEKLTNVASSLAGWHDLTPIGFKRMGLYWHVQEETYVGPAKAGERRNDITYALSLAKTWTQPDANVFRNFTTFLEGYARTDLDGSHRGRTSLSLTPGVRTNLGNGHAIITGVELPLSHPRTYDATVRMVYIYNF